MPSHQALVKAFDNQVCQKTVLVEVAAVSSENDSTEVQM